MRSRMMLLGGGCLLLAALCAWLAVQNVHSRARERARAAAVDREPAPRPAPPEGGAPPGAEAAAAAALRSVLPRGPGADGDAHAPFDPLALAFFLPAPGEDRAAYLQRIHPVVMEALLPQRARVAALRDAYAAAAGLGDAERRALDDAVREAGEGMKDRILEAALAGELDPARARPARVVAFARDLLSLAADADERFRAALTPEQLAALDADRFDVVEYLFFTTSWEELLGVGE